MLWSTVSKAALRSNSTKIAEAPESRVRRISLWTFKSADSVLCNALKPDWKNSSTELFLKNVCNWITTTFSKTLDRKGSFEIGLKLDSSVESKLDLFIKGCTIACLKWGGMEPVAKQQLIRIRILWPTTLKTCFKKRAGIISWGLMEGLRCLTTSVNDVMETGSNWWKTAGHVTKGTKRSWSDGWIEHLISEILSEKYIRKFSHVCKETSELSETGGLITAQ